MGSLKQKGYTLLEILLVTAIFLASITLIYTLLKPASLKAGIEREQTHINAVIEAVQGSFGRAGGSYTKLNNTELANLRLPGLRLDGTSLTSATGDTMIVRPAQIFEAGDGFDVVYQGINRQKCLGFIKAFHPKSYMILVGNAQTLVQQPSNQKNGSLVSEDKIIEACSAAEFQAQSGDVVFRFYERLSPGGTERIKDPDAANNCRPQQESQNEACPEGQTGLRILQRKSTCLSDGTPDWGDWTVISDSCEVPSIGPSGPITKAQSCFPRTQGKTMPCPQPSFGQIFFERELTCNTLYDSGETVGEWAITHDTCGPVEPPPPCEPTTESRPIADADNNPLPNGGCPPNYGGQITQARSSTCPVGGRGKAVWSPWVVVSNTCRPEGRCHPLPSQKEKGSCPAGFTGSIDKVRHSYCASADANVAWGPWLEENKCISGPIEPQYVADVISWLPTAPQAKPSDKFIWNLELDKAVVSDTVFTVALRLDGYKGPALAYGQVTVFAGQRTAQYIAPPLSAYTPAPATPLKYNAELVSASYDTTLFKIAGLPTNSTINVSGQPALGGGGARCTGGNACHMEAYYRLELCGGGDGSSGGTMSGEPICSNNSDWWAAWHGGRETACLNRLSGGGTRIFYICR